jgi:catechol 2,3-dioxygenase-like lactoylglutathione lyase family enzyme
MPNTHQEETMIQSSYVGHLQINIDPKNIAFYKDLFLFLGWTILFENANLIGMGCENGTSLWFEAGKEATNDYDGPGMNHLAIAVKAQVDVDEAAAYLQQHGIKALFETPRHRPDFSRDPETTYYQVMFESPDRVLLEVVYKGPRTK